SEGAGCPVRKFPLAPRTLRAQHEGREVGCAFFCLLFFAQAKKSKSPKGEMLFVETHSVGDGLLLR
ncbi:MAG TPA: hypothetical protein VN017_08175, partial [Pseudoxanthomonas sp.]|nr:hypothetical protein [Pseudoxanthomonas sp.]